MTKIKLMNKEIHTYNIIALNLAINKKKII